jgi:hypothetical protein
MAVDISPLASKSPEFTGSLIVQTANRRDGCHLKRPSRPLAPPRRAAASQSRLNGKDPTFDA